MMFDYNFTPETLYEEARKVELETTLLYLEVCKALSTACTATAPYIIGMYRKEERGLRYQYLKVRTLALDAEDERTLNALGSTRVLLNTVRERLLP